MGEQKVCGFCGVSCDVTHKDHIIPHSRGGGDDATNCIVSCAGCNLAKSDRTPSEWQPTGLPTWIYELEPHLAKKYGMKSRSRKGKPGTAWIPGSQLLVHDSPICLEPSEARERPCNRPAGWEIYSMLDGKWGAYCGKCIRFYNPKNHREISDVRSTGFVLAQLHCGTLKLELETTLATIAKLGGVSTLEYVDLARKMVLGSKKVRAGLKLLAPSLRLEMWEATND